MATAAAVAMIGSTLALSGPALAGPGAAAPTTDTIGGFNRFGTAGLVADELDVSSILVVNGFKFPDGLTGAALNEPILATRVDSLPPRTLAWLEANKAAITNIEIVGGVDVVSDAVETELATYGTVTRIAGANRYETAIAVAEAAQPLATTIIIATGLDFPDALAAGPLAIEASAPIILNNGDALRDDVKAYLDANPQITSAYIVGGAAAVPAAVQTELEARIPPVTVTRLAGPDREATAVAIANELQSIGTYDQEAIIVNRGKFADAMVGGPLAANVKAPILLVDVDGVRAATATYLNDNGQTIAKITSIGGEAVVQSSTLAAAGAESTGTTPNSNQTLMVSPAGAATLGRVANPDTNSTDNRQYTATNLDSTTLYVVALFSGANVQTDAGGVVTFDDVDSNNVADRTDPATDITDVNGVAPPAGTSLVTVAPVNGTISFTIDGDGANEVVVPVIWLDSVAGGMNVLNLNVPAIANATPKTPAEAFGLGGTTTYTRDTATKTPTSTATSVTDTGAGDVPNLLDGNDVIQIQFDSSTTLAADASITLTDPDGTVGTVICGMDATCSSGGGSTPVITITMTLPVIGIAPGDIPGLATGAATVISSATGFTNAAGAWNLAKSGIVAGGKRVISTNATINNSNLRANAFTTVASVATGTARITAIGGTNEVQTLTTGTSSFTLTFDGQTTTSLAANATAAAIQTALEALSNVGAGNVAVTGGPVATGTNGAAATITFTGELGSGDVPLITADPLTPGDGRGVAATKEGARPANLAEGDTVTVYNPLTGVSIGSAVVLAFGPTVADLIPNTTTPSTVNVVAKGTTNTTLGETRTQVKATIA